MFIFFHDNYVYIQIEVYRKKIMNSVGFRYIPSLD